MHNLQPYNQARSRAREVGCTAHSIDASIAGKAGNADSKGVSLVKLHGYGILLRIQEISGEKLVIQGDLSIPHSIGGSMEASSMAYGRK